MLSIFRFLTAGRTKRAPRAPWDDKSIPIVSCSSETNKGQPVTLTQLHLFPFDWWKESKTLHSKCAIYFPPQNQMLTHMPICFFFVFFFTNTTIRHNTLLRSETSYCNVISASAFLIQPEWIFGWFKRSLANLDTMEGKNWDTAVHAVPSVFHNSHSNCSLKSSSSKLDRLFFFLFFFLPLFLSSKDRGSRGFSEILQVIQPPISLAPLNFSLCCTSKCRRRLTQSSQTFTIAPST